MTFEKIFVHIILPLSPFIGMGIAQIIHGIFKR